MNTKEQIIFYSLWVIWPWLPKEQLPWEKYKFCAQYTALNVGKGIQDTETLIISQTPEISITTQYSKQEN